MAMHVSCRLLTVGAHTLRTVSNRLVQSRRTLPAKLPCLGLAVLHAYLADLTLNRWSPKNLSIDI